MKQVCTITIKNLRLKAIIGFLPKERIEKQDVIINVKFKYDATHAIATDDVEHAVNYRTITKAIIKLVEDSGFNLIETLADTIYQLAKENPLVFDIDVQVEKVNCLSFCDSAVVKITS